MKFEAIHDPFANMQNLFFVEAKISVELDLTKFKNFAKLSKDLLYRIFRCPRIFAKNKDDSIEVCFTSFSPRNIVISIAVLLFMMENTNFETKDSKRKEKIVLEIVNFVGEAEIKPNIKTRRKWSKVLKEMAENEDTKQFAKMHNFSM